MHRQGVSSRRALEGLCPTAFSLNVHGALQRNYDGFRWTTGNQAFELLHCLKVREMLRVGEEDEDDVKSERA